LEAKSIMLYLTNNCNLQCPYCFVEKDTRDMDFKIAKNTVDFLLSQGKGSRSFNINFFGGEPLLKFNLIKEIIQYSKKESKKYDKEITFGITTNGSLFTKEIVDYFWENNVGILFSWDGDKKRIMKVKGSKAYKRMLNSVKLLKKKGYNLQARTTVSPHDLRMVDFVKYILKIGFNGISFCPMTGSKDWNQEETDEAYMKLADYYIEQTRKGKVPELSYIEKDLLISIGLRKPSSRPCGAGKGLLAVTVDGKILPCQHPETWEKNHILGDVFDKKIDKDIRKPFLNYTRDDFLGCESCIARAHCIGACLHCNYDENKDILNPWKGGCIWTRARYKAVKHIFRELYVKEKNIHLIKNVLKNRVGWLNPARETIFDVKDLEDHKKDGKLEDISFKIDEEDLKSRIGDKIIRFLDKIRGTNKNIRVTKPLPPCIFNFNSIETFRKYNIPMAKNPQFRIPKSEEIKIDSCDRNNEPEAEEKKFKELYQYYIQNADIPEICENCVHRIRGNCNYGYFGF